MSRKRIVAIAMICILLFSSIGCSRLVSIFNSEKPLTISTSFYPIYIMTMNIAKNVPGVKITNLSNEDTGCLHDVQLTPTDLQVLASTDIFIINGSGMEGYLTKVIENIPDIQIINASQDLQLDNPENEEEHEEHVDQDTDHKHEINPHVWVSVSLAIQQVKTIGQQLAQVDPAHESLYLQNTNEYVAKLETLKEKMHEELHDFKNQDIVTFHEAFEYFADEFGLDIVAVIQKEPGSEPSARELAETIKLIKEKKVKAIFVEPQYSDKAAQTIARETQARVFTLDPAVIGPMDENAYINTMENNLKVLQEALRE